MKFSWRECAAGICAVLGAMSWLYLGAYRLWKGPLMDLIEAHLAGNITLWRWIDITAGEGGLCWWLVSVLV